jgi:hypothetical protein
LTGAQVKSGGPEQRWSARKTTREESLRVAF